MPKPSSEPVYGVDPLRELIMENLKQTLINMKQGDEPGQYRVEYTDGYVDRCDFGEQAKMKKAVAQIYDESETKTDDTQVQRCVISVAIEYILYIEKGMNANQRLNLYAAETERCIMVDYTRGGYAINCTILRTEYDNEYLFDKQIRGTIFMNITYRHKTGDPRVSA